MIRTDTSRLTSIRTNTYDQQRLRALLHLLVVSSLCLACSETAITAPEPEVCTPDTCPDGWCKLTVSFSDDCTDLFAEAEVLIGNALEPENALLGTPFTSVSDVPQGTTVPVWIRAEGWQWKVELTCNDPARDGDFTLSCNTDDTP